jgi:hypothetical protein
MIRHTCQGARHPQQAGQRLGTRWFLAHLIHQLGLYAIEQLIRVVVAPEVEEAPGES